MQSRVGAYRNFFLLLGSIALLPSTQANQTQTYLEEIVVTASKQQESLQDVDQAVTVLTKSDLKDRNIESFVDLNTFAPGLNVSENEGSRLVMSVRGVGNEANQNAIANPSVSFHLDGIYIASPSSARALLLDVEQIEVLRGPQGSLFGQNASGGVLNVTTAKPKLIAQSGSFSVGLGSFNQQQIKGHYNMPMSDSAAVRVAMSANRHDGFSENLNLNQRLDDENSKALRAQVSLDLSQSTNLNLTLQTASNDRNGPAQKGIFDKTPSTRALDQDYHSSWELSADLASAVLDSEFLDYRFKSLTSYQRDQLLISRDNDRHNLESLPPFTILPSAYEPWDVSQQTFTQEFQLLSPRNNERWNWIAGGFYLRTNVDTVIQELIDFGADGTFDPFTVEDVRSFSPGDYGFISDSNPQRRGYSIFFQGNYSISSRTRLVAGTRYTIDDVTSYVTNFFGRSGTDILEISSSSVSGRFSLERDLSSQVMTYLSLVRGFKPGGSNLTYGRENEIAPIVVHPTFKQETVAMTEWGIKSYLLNDRMMLNGAIFHYSYQDMQYQATDPEVFEGGVNNIPSSVIQGLEVEWTSQLTSNLRIDLRLSNQNSKITSTHFTLDNVASDQVTNDLLAQGLPLFGEEIQKARAEQIVDVKGNQLPKIPNATQSLLLSYTASIDSSATLKSTLTFSRRGDLQYRVFNHSSRDRVPAYTTTNLVMVYQPTDKNWELSFRGLNLTDSEGINSRFTDVFGVGASSEQYIPPRRFQMAVNIDF